eukprot:11641184-Heterocapsa_arctica.AAC.1
MFHTSLQQEGNEVGFPQLLMRALCGLYEGFRAIAYGTSVSQAFWAVGTIIPGCSCATTMAKVLLIRLLRQIAANFPSMHIKHVVDDVSMQSLGTERFVGMVLARAGHQFALGIKRLGLPLSAKKPVFTSSSTSLAKKLTASWEG